MKEILYTWFFLAAWANTIGAQSHPFEVRFSHQIEVDLAEGKISASRAGLLYSFIGDYYSSIQLSDIPVSWGVDTMDLSGWRTADATDMVLRQAEKHRLVIVSENHLKPQHRIFTRQLLEKLSVKGFRHLGLETFANVENENDLLDSTLMARKYPLDNPITGIYTMEPQMGNLVREAISLGFHLFAYEQSDKVPGKDRDEVQADNIIRYLNDNPDAKTILLCGFHHAVESNLIKRGEAHWMAKYIKDKTGIDPLTVYQDNFTEKVAEGEHRILSERIFNLPSVFINKDGEVLQISPHVDIEVIHPQTRFIHGRPHWLFENSDLKPVEVILGDKEWDYPILVAARTVGEEDSVPLDRVELKHRYDNKKLALPSGEYTVSIFNGKNTSSYTCKVD